MSTASNIHIQQVAVDTPAYSQVYDLREEILRKPLGLSLANEDLSGEKDEIILAAFSGNEVVGCLIIHKKDKETVKLRQMAVAAGQQGTGLGRLLMDAAENWVRQNGYSRIELHARKVAAGFYEKLGYQYKGDEFMEVLIPHFLMTKERL